NRSLIVLLFAILLILISSMTLGAQGRGGHFAGGRAGFNSTPVVTPGFAPVARPPLAVARPPFAVARPPFAVAPGRVPSFGGRPGRPIPPIRPFVAQPAFGFYSPYIWPSTIYGASPYSLYPDSPYPYPAYSQPAYAYPDTAAAAANQNEIDLAYQVGQLSA